MDTRDTKYRLRNLAAATWLSGVFRRVLRRPIRVQIIETKDGGYVLVTNDVLTASELDQIHSKWKAAIAMGLSEFVIKEPLF